MNKTPLKYRKMRKKKYLDHALQGWLMGLMLIFQLSFVAAGILYFYVEVSNLIEQYLYSIHRLDISIFSHEMKVLAGKIILIYLVSNFIGLIIAHYIWIFYITKVLTEFNDLTQKTKHLDFSIDNDNSSHLVNEVAKAWRTQQRKNWLKIIEKFEKIPHQESRLAEQKQQVLDRLKDIERLV